jgi:hypothetical protein
MKKIKSSCIISSAAFSVKRSVIKQYSSFKQKCPAVGDLVVGEVIELGCHNTIESKLGRIHTINVGKQVVFVFGSRYAPDQCEGVVPDSPQEFVELFHQGGVIGNVKTKNQLFSVTTKIKVLGYVCDNEGKVINTTNYSLIHPKIDTYHNKARSKLILCVGTAMNSGKTYAAAASCYALSSMGKSVRAAKITGVASLKDISLMDDCGADYVADFTYFGYPSTYMLEGNQLLSMFQAFDLKYGNNPNDYIVIEFSDGIFQRETAMLLKMPEIQKRSFFLILFLPFINYVKFSAHDTFLE